MAEARLKVIQAGPHVSFQDGGRPGLMRYGVTRSGPMDRLAHAAANRALGRPEDATAIEVSLGGLVLECTAGALSLAVAGGGFIVSAAGVPVPAWGVLTLRTGERLTIRPGHWGSWCSLALAGDPQVPSWLGHTATHTLSGRGGGLLKPGAEIVVENARVIGSRRIPCPVFARPLRMAAVVPGPQDHHFRPGAIGIWSALVESRISAVVQLRSPLGTIFVAARSSIRGKGCFCGRPWRRRAAGSSIIPTSVIPIRGVSSTLSRSLPFGAIPVSVPEARKPTC